MDLPIVPILCRAFEGHLGQELTEEVASRIVAQVAARCYPGPLDTSGIAPKVVGSYTIACVRAANSLKQLFSMHEKHWQETEGYRHSLQFNPDYDRAIDLEAQGRYLLIVAIDNRTGDFVGNYSLYVARSMHTQQLIATEDTLFVSKEHRRGRLGIGMIRYGEDVLRHLGVEELNVSVKLVNDTGPMIERMGYKPTGKMYTKLLKEAAHVLT